MAITCGAARLWQGEAREFRAAECHDRETPMREQPKSWSWLVVASFLVLAAAFAISNAPSNGARAANAATTSDDGQSWFATLRFRELTVATISSP